MLGPTGYNFGAGMTNGAAFVYDPEGEFPGRINGESVLLEPVHGEVDAEDLRALIERHLAATGSAHARRLLEDWDTHTRVLLEGHPPRLDRCPSRSRSRGGGTGTFPRVPPTEADAPEKYVRIDRRAVLRAAIGCRSGVRRGSQALQLL